MYMYSYSQIRLFEIAYLSPVWNNALFEAQRCQINIWKPFGIRKWKIWATLVIYSNVSPVYFSDGNINATDNHKFQGWYVYSVHHCVFPNSTLKTIIQGFCSISFNFNQLLWKKINQCLFGGQFSSAQRTAQRGLPRLAEPVSQCWRCLQPVQGSISNISVSNPSRISLNHHHDVLCNWQVSNRSDGDCDANNQRRCFVGNLSKKLGLLTVAGNATAVKPTQRFFTDMNLPLSGPQSIVGKSVVIIDDFAPLFRGDRLACTP